jgi:hypothetical protein
MVMVAMTPLHIYVYKKDGVETQNLETDPVIHHVTDDDRYDVIPHKTK